jgi:hypothetical protein
MIFRIMDFEELGRLKELARERNELIEKLEVLNTLEQEILDKLSRDTNATIKEEPDNSLSVQVKDKLIELGLFDLDVLVANKSASVICINGEFFYLGTLYDGRLPNYNQCDIFKNPELKDDRPEGRSEGDGLYFYKSGGGASLRVRLSKNDDVFTIDYYQYQPPKTYAYNGPQIWDLLWSKGFTKKVNSQ